MQRLVLALVPALLLLLAGCIGGGSPEGSATTGPPVVTEATVDAMTGGIEGLVTDDELLPIQGAHVTIPGGDPVKTDEGGKFALSNLVPGEQVVYATRLGYFEKQMRATVKAGEITQVDFVLERIPVSEPGYDEVMSWKDKLPVSNACAEREAYDADAIEEWPDGTRGLTWQKYTIPINATKPDGTELLAIRTKIELKHQPSDATVDIDMRLSDASGKSLADGWTGSADELIDYQKILQPGSYTLYVCYWGGAQADYKITATISYEQGDRAKYLRENPKQIEYA